MSLNNDLMASFGDEAVYKLTFPNQRKQLKVDRSLQWKLCFLTPSVSSSRCWIGTEACFFALRAYETVTMFTYRCPRFVRDLRGSLIQLISLLSLQDKDPNCSDTSNLT